MVSCFRKPVLFKLFKVLDFSRNQEQFKNCHFSIADIITEKRCTMMHFEIIPMDKRIDIYLSMNFGEMLTHLLAFLKLLMSLEKILLFFRFCRRKYPIHDA